MQIHTDIPLKNLTTMRLGGNARFMTDVHTPEDAAKIYQNAKKHNLPIFIIGDGSNIIARDEGFNGIIIRVRIPGFTVLSDDINSTTIKIGAGENWDKIVKKTIAMHLTGIEAMSAIPGTAGASPVQNVGAYGQEISDTLQSLSAYDGQTNTFVTLNNSDCDFSYRNSMFREKQAGRYIITSITLKLSKNLPTPPFYESLQKYLDENDIKIYTPETIRNAVIEIRKNRLPDPSVSPNSGSFFTNAIVEKWQLDDLRKTNSDIRLYDLGDGRYKIPAGWLIEQAGLKGSMLHGMRVYDKNALILVNESAKTYADLSAARDEIIGKVRDKFRVQIKQEPLEIK